MTRSELLEQIILSDGLVAMGRPNRPGGVLIPQKITIHNTSNPSAGANAKAHANFIRNTGYYSKPDGSKNWVSWHFTVDDKQTIRHIPVNEKAYHAGSTANNLSIAIEVCMHAGIDQVKANDRAAQLAALLCYDHALDLDAVVTHQHWSGKNCPVLLLKQWPEFKNRIAYYLAQVRTDVQTVSVLKETEERNLIEEEIMLCWQSDLDSADFPSVQNGFNHKFLSNERIDLPILPNANPQSNVHEFIHH